jgi:hypothetical protein
MRTYYVDRAYKMLVDDEEMTADARACQARADATIAGSILSVTFAIPRRNAEFAVREALYRIIREEKRRDILLKKALRALDDLPPPQEP